MQKGNFSTQRYRSEDMEFPNNTLNLQGKSALKITAERLVQEAIINLFYRKPKLGIPIHSEIHETEIDMKHQVYAFDERLDDVFIMNLLTYDEIYKFLNRLAKLEKQEELAALMIRFARSHEPITLDDLRKMSENADETDATHVNRCCFLIMQREETQWHSAVKCPGLKDFRLGMSVTQARCLIMLKEGHLSFEC